jgi:predicted negative regulator of RcsB-dependent stress response
MKKKERAHLKEDPFQKFVEKVLEILRKFKRELIIGGGIIVAVLIVIVVISVFKSHSTSVENRLYARGLSIQNNPDLSVDEKIEKLGQLNNKNGISAANQLFLASLYFEKGEIEKAGDALKEVPECKIKIIDDQKKLIEADILTAMGKPREALDLLNKVMADSQSDLPKDFLLIKISRLQIQTDQKKAAADTLQKLIDEFPQSVYFTEARTLLEQTK